MDDATEADEIRLRERELKLKEDELAHRREMDARSSRFQVSPWTTGLIALLTTVATAGLTGFLSHRADVEKGKRDLALREREQQFQIVLKATENRTPEDAAKNLVFFVDIGYLPDPDSAIRRKAASGEVPIITTGRPENPIVERMEGARSPVAGPAVSVAGVPFLVRDHVLLAQNGAPVSVVSTPSVSRDNSRRFVVLHSTWTQTARQATSVMSDSARNASAHLVIDRDGTVIQMAPFDYATWHAGRSEWREVRGLNRHSIGITLVNLGELRRRGDRWVSVYGGEAPAEEIVRPEGAAANVAWHAFTEPQIRRLQEILRLLRAAYPSITEVVAHSEVSPGRKRDPGPAFPLERVRGEFSPRQSQGELGEAYHPAAIAADSG